MWLACIIAISFVVPNLSVHYSRHIENIGSIYVEVITHHCRWSPKAISATSSVVNSSTPVRLRLLAFHISAIKVHVHN